MLPLPAPLFWFPNLSYAAGKRKGNRPLASQGVDATGANLYRLNTLSTGGPLISKSFQKAVTVADVWRMQLGVRYMFNW